MALFSVGDILLCDSKIEYARGHNFYKTKVDVNYLVIDHIDSDWGDYVLVELTKKHRTSFNLSELDVDERHFQKVGHLDVVRGFDAVIQDLLDKYEGLEAFVRQE